MNATPSSALVPLLGLPTYSATGEELRLLSLITATPSGLSFVDLAQNAPDPVATYGALFSLLTKGNIVSVELPDGAVGYGRRVRRRSAACGSLSLPLAA